MLAKEAAEMFKGGTGLSDKDMAKLHPGLEKLVNNALKTMAYRVVAEVVNGGDPAIGEFEQTGIVIVAVVLRVSKGAGFGPGLAVVGAEVELIVGPGTNEDVLTGAE